MIHTLSQLISLASMIFSVLLLARVVISWINPDPANPLVAFVHRVTEPLLRPIRSILPTMGGIDFSPVLALVGIRIAEELVLRALSGLAVN